MLATARAEGAQDYRMVTSEHTGLLRLRVAASAEQGPMRAPI